jgi:hypothetical protein
MLCPGRQKAGEHPVFDEMGWQKAKKELDDIEERYSSGQATQHQRRDLYKKYADSFGLWEKFPYPYRIKARQVLECSEGYNSFFEIAKASRNLLLFSISANR